MSTREEQRVEAYLAKAAIAAGFEVRYWDVAQGVTDGTGATVSGLGQTTLPDQVLRLVDERAKGGTQRTAWILRDLPPWLQPPIGLTTLRRLRNLAKRLPSVSPERAQVVIMISPAADVPPDLATHVTFIEWALPDRDEHAAAVTALVDGIADETVRASVTKELAKTKDAVIDAAVGLSAEEAQATYARSLVQYRRIDPAVIAAEKRRIIGKERVIEWYDPLPGGLASVGGLANLKDWLIQRSLAFTEEARKYGLPPPKGALLLGPPGTGKSLTAKAAATAWDVPLIRLDMGGLRSKWLGESEGNLRRALKVIEVIGRCVVWLDEIEKAIAGGVQGAADGGVSADALGTILSWMQERSGSSFIIATANNVAALPPELLRKGRFDEVWWVDLPTATERAEILRAALATHARADAEIDLGAVAQATDGFTGSEIAALVPDAMFAAFADGAREITTDDLLVAADTVVPLSRTAAEQISSLREWAKGRARPAGRTEQGAPASTARVLDM